MRNTQSETCIIYTYLKKKNTRSHTYCSFELNERIHNQICRRNDKKKHLSGRDLSVFIYNACRLRYIYT